VVGIIEIQEHVKSPFVFLRSLRLENLMSRMHYTQLIVNNLHQYSSIPGEEKTFQSFKIPKPTLEPTHSSIQCVPRAFSSEGSSLGLKFSTQFNLVQR
jgi:hypothetical protein